MDGKLLALAVAALLTPALARSHEVLHDVDRGKAVAVRAYESDGEPLAGAEFEVFSPSAPDAPYLRGRTDRAGWLAFVPDAPGAWRVRVVEASGHGLVTTVDVPPPGAVSPGAPAPAAARPATTAVRPLVGVLLIAAIFGALLALARRKSARR